jgi:dihydroorotase
MKKTLLRNGSLVTEGGLTKADVLIGVTGEIESVKPEIKDHKDADVIACQGRLLFPLLIDCHVHFREPGLTHKATMQTEAASALAGGVGTVCEMPNTIPPTVTVAALADKVRTAEKVDHADIRFYFGVTEAAHLFTLKELWTGTSLELRRLKRHCCGVKLYLDHSTGDQKVDGGIVEDIFKACAEHNIPLVAHCEDADMNAAAKAKNTRTDVAAHSEMRPAESEERSIKDAVGFVKKTGAALHVAHLSTAKGLAAVREAKKAGLPVTCEVSPHHLLLTVDDYASLGTLGKMNPPLRTKADADALWAGIKDGTVDCVSTDHAPHTLEEKRAGEPLSAPSGVPGVETMLPLLLDAASRKKISYEDILRLCFTNPNRIFSLGVHGIEPKKPARIAIVDPTAEWVVTGKDLHSKCGWTPFEGKKVKGRVVQTIAH